jgi:hypothetical protein
VGFPRHLFIAMNDLYTRFNKELTEKVTDFRKLFAFLSDSYSGSDADLIRIRQVYRELMDMKTFFLSKNSSISSAKDRSWRDDYQSKEALTAHINGEINPFIEMLQFIIEMYEEDRAA